MDDFKSRISLSATDRFTSDSGIGRFCAIRPRTCDFQVGLRRSQNVHWIYSFFEIPMGKRKKPGIEILGFVR
jgi:hypothetical protein